MKRETKKTEKSVINKPSKFLYWLIVPLGKLIARIVYGYKSKADKRIKAIKTPVVCIGTHSCTMDIAFMMISMMPRPLNIICGKDVFTWKPIKPILKKAGLIPISQFAADLYSIRLMKKAVDIGCSLALFPEGKRSIDGRNLHYLSPSIAKLIKFLDVPIVVCHNNGGYSLSPRWSKKKRSGKVVQVSKLLFDQEEVRTLSVKEIYERIVRELTYNDNEYQQQNHLRVKCKAPALGVHYILYKCPKCGKEYQMVSSDSELKCEACGNTAVFDEYGNIVPKDESCVVFDRLDKWYDFEKEAVRAELNEPDFIMSHPVTWLRNDPQTNKYYEVGKGNLYVNGLVLGFEGETNEGENYKVELSLKNLHTVVQKISEAIDLTIDNVINRFTFDENKFSAKYNLVVEEAFRKINKLD